MIPQPRANARTRGGKEPGGGAKGGKRGKHKGKKKTDPRKEKGKKKPIKRARTGRKRVGLKTKLNPKQKTERKKGNRQYRLCKPEAKTGIRVFLKNLFSWSVKKKRVGQIRTK